MVINVTKIQTKLNVEFIVKNIWYALVRGDNYGKE